MKYEVVKKHMKIVAIFIHHLDLLLTLCKADFISYSTTWQVLFRSAIPMMVRDEPTLSNPHYIAESYRQAYKLVHGHEPAIRYVGNHWFHVNGETAHRQMVIDEVTRLRELAMHKHIVATEKSIVQKLIAKLRRA
jgi:hypothetical protein